MPATLLKPSASCTEPILSVQECRQCLCAAVRRSAVKEDALGSRSRPVNRCVTHPDVRFHSSCQVYPGLLRDLAQRGQVAVRRGRMIAQIAHFFMKKELETTSVSSGTAVQRTVCSGCLPLWRWGSSTLCVLQRDVGNRFYNVRCRHDFTTTLP